MQDNTKGRIVRVIGHKNPDTDSICSAISYAYLKNQISDKTYEARRAGDISAETNFVLKHFGFTAPRLSEDMSPTILNIDIRKEKSISKDLTILSVLKQMSERDVDTLCITNDEEKLEGVVTLKDLAKANLDTTNRAILAEAKTNYSSVLETINGEMVFGDPDATIDSGNILIATTSDLMSLTIKKNDIILLTSRRDVQESAIEQGAGCLIICMGANIDDDILEKAKEKNCFIIRTENDTYSTSKLISYSVPVRHYMSHENLISFHVNTPVDEARKIMASQRIHYYPILDSDERYIGMISRRNLLNVNRKEVILVDHNEASQAVEGLDEAKILEIIDHHRIGTLETGSPVFFRNEPVGCTATIVYSMFKENDIAIPQNIAGLLLSAILSDTLLFHSPTCTLVDKAAAKELAEIAREDIDAYGNALFEAGEDLSGRTAKDLLYTDYKEFAIGSKAIAVGQSFFVSENSCNKAKEMMSALFTDVLDTSGKDMIFYMLTHVPTQETELFFAGKESDEIVSAAFNIDVNDNHVTLPGIVSRKQQFIPPIREQLLK